MATAVRIRCPGCGTELQVGRELAGQTLECSFCSKRFRFGAPQTKQPLSTTIKESGQLRPTTSTESNDPGDDISPAAKGIRKRSDGRRQPIVGRLKGAFVALAGTFLGITITVGYGYFLEAQAAALAADNQGNVRVARVPALEVLGPFAVGFFLPLGIGIMLLGAVDAMKQERPTVWHIVCLVIAVGCGIAAAVVGTQHFDAIFAQGG